MNLYSLFHELRYLVSWRPLDGHHWSVLFQEDRDQLYGIRNRTNHVNNATPYSPAGQAITAGYRRVGTIKRRV